jgi:hypothetical protein
MLSHTPHYYEINGRAAEIARALGSPVGGAEHLFLAMLHDGEWPVSAISGLVDLARAEAAVRGILDSPGYSPPPPPRSAIGDALPEGTNFGFNGADGRTWIHVSGSGGSLGREVSREVLNTALVSLGRPGAQQLTHDRAPASHRWVMSSTCARYYRLKCGGHKQ